MMQVDYPVDAVASSHGNPVTDLAQTMPKIREGLRQVGQKYSLR